MSNLGMLHLSSPNTSQEIQMWGCDFEITSVPHVIIVLRKYGLCVQIWTEPHEQNIIHFSLKLSDSSQTPARRSRGEESQRGICALRFQVTNILWQASLSMFRKMSWHWRVLAYTLQLWAPSPYQNTGSFERISPSKTNIQTELRLKTNIKCSISSRWALHCLKIMWSRLLFSATQSCKLLSYWDSTGYRV